MRVVPPPRVWARIPSWDWHRAGVEGVRARTIITAADVASRLEQALDLDSAEADRRLRSLPGIGPWTSAEIRQRAAGDADAVSVGDYHLPRTVGWTLARQITDDAGMLELLAPYAGPPLPRLPPHRAGRQRTPRAAAPACPSATTAPSKPTRLPTPRLPNPRASLTPRPPNHPRLPGPPRPGQSPGLPGGASCLLLPVQRHIDPKPGPG